ncbi:MAG: sugar ABC transporter substrate-binding protein [Caldilineaceae bacterium]|nr:sugar ABC transporter substrate-binding protein [Caldilineaceae bacterium]
MSSGMSRRRFLQVTGTGVLGMMAAACVPAAAPGGTAAESGTAEGSTLVFSSYTWSGYEASMNQVIDMWLENKPDVTVERQFTATDYWTKLQTQIASGTPLDVGIAEYTRTVSYAKNGVLQPLDEFIDRDGFDLEQMFPEALAQYRWVEGEFDSGGEGGTMYGLPADAQGYIFVYNKNLFDEAGVAYPTDDWTWDDLVTAAQAMTNADTDRWGVDLGGLNLMKGHLVYAAGGENLSPDFRASMLDSEATMSAYQWAWDLKFTHGVAAKEGGEASHPFLSGRTAMYFDGVWWIADLVTITEFGWDVAMFPKHPQTGKRTTSLESDGWSLYKQSTNADLGWELISFLASREGQETFSKLNYLVPPCIPGPAEAWYAQTPPDNLGKALQNVVEDSRKVGTTFYDEAVIWDTVWPIIQRALVEGEELEPVMLEAHDVLNQELERAWERFEA